MLARRVSRHPVDVNFLKKFKKNSRKLTITILWGNMPSGWPHLNCLNCDSLHSSATQRPRVRVPLNPRNPFFFGLFRNCLNCDSLQWSHTHFICIPAVHIISFCVSFLSRVDELNKLAGLQCMGLHSSGW